MKTGSKIVLLLTGAALTASVAATAYADNNDGWRKMHQGDGQGYGRNMPDNMRQGMGNGGQRVDGRGMRGPMGEGPGSDLAFQKADKDNSGTVTLEEFEAAKPFSIASADANSDGEVSVDELTDAMMREMLKRRAEAMIERLDANNDGQLSLAEIQDSDKKMFDRLDVDGSGAIEKDEMRGGPGMRGDGPGGDFRRMHRFGNN